MASMSRTKAIAAFALVLSVMGMTATAWACTAVNGYKGTFTLAQSLQTTKTNIGDNGTTGFSHRFCNNAASAVMTVKKATGNFTVSGGPSTGVGNCSSQLPGGKYDIKYLNGTSDCLSSTTTLGTQITLTGAAGETYSQSVPSTALTASTTLRGVCISDTAHVNGIHMNVSVIA